MAIRKPEPKEFKTCPIGLALLALEPTDNPLEMPVESFDPAPVALDIDMQIRPAGVHATVMHALSAASRSEKDVTILRSDVS
jgi:hypothetical protein